MWWLLHTSWREFGRAPLIPPDPDVRRVYHEMLRRLQRDMLVLLMAVGLPLSLVFGVQLWQGIFGDRTVPSSLFVIHVGRVLLLLVCLFVLLQQQLLVALTAVMEMGMHESMQLLMGELRHQLSPAEQSTALGLSLSEYYRRRRDAVAVLLDMLLRHGEVPDC